MRCSAASTSTSSAGEVVCLIGPSGSGKTTLLRCVNHLEVPTAGRVFLAGELIGQYTRRNRLVPLPPRELAEQRASIGMVFQHFNLFGNKTAIENIVEAPIQVTRTPKQVARPRPRRTCWAEVGWPTRPRPIHVSFRAAKSSASRSLARWRCPRS